MGMGTGISGGSECAYDYEDDFEASYDSDERHLQVSAQEASRGVSAPAARDRDVTAAAAGAGAGAGAGVRASSAPLPAQPAAAVASDLKSGAQPRRRATATPSWITKRKWVIGERIGHGSFGEVFQGMSHTGRLFAVKQLHIVGQKTNVVDTLTNEISLMRAYAHPNIVGYLGADVDEAAGVVNIFQEWVSGGSLAHLLTRFGPFKERAVVNYTRQILQGLSFLHANGIIHRDVKGGNVLVDESGHVKLADFGASTKVNTLTETTVDTVEIKGTPYFMAPEVIGKSRYGRKGDVWAVGCTMIQMLNARPPWKDKNLNGLVQLHILLEGWVGPPEYPKDQVSDLCQAAIALCFHKDEKARPSAQQLLDNPLFATTHAHVKDAADGVAGEAGAGGAGGGATGRSYIAGKGLDDSWAEDSQLPVMPRTLPRRPPRDQQQMEGAAAVGASAANFNSFGNAATAETRNDDEYMEDSGVMEDMRMQLSRLVRSQDAPLPPSTNPPNPRLVQARHGNSGDAAAGNGSSTEAGVGIAAGGAAAGGIAIAPAPSSSPALLFKPASASGSSPNPYARSKDSNRDSTNSNSNGTEGNSGVMARVDAQLKQRKFAKAQLDQRRIQEREAAEMDSANANAANAANVAGGITVSTSRDLDKLSMSRTRNGIGSDDTRVRATKSEVTNPYSRGAVGLSKVGHGNSGGAGGWDSSAGVVGSNGAGRQSRGPPPSASSAALTDTAKASTSASKAAISIYSKRTVVPKVGGAAGSAGNFSGSSRSSSTTRQDKPRGISVKSGRSSSNTTTNTSSTSNTGDGNVSSARDSEYTPALPQRSQRITAGAEAGGRYNGAGSIEDSPLLASPSYPLPAHALSFDESGAGANAAAAAAAADGGSGDGEDDREWRDEQEEDGGRTGGGGVGVLGVREKEHRASLLCEVQRRTRGDGQKGRRGEHCASVVGGEAEAEAEAEGGLGG